MANPQKIAVVGGDGIGPDVINEGLKVLDVVAKKHGLKFETTNFNLGAAHFHKTGEVLHDATMAEIAKHDAIFLDRKSTRLNSSHVSESRMRSSA